MLTTELARFRNSTAGLPITASFPSISSIFSCFCHISKTLIHPSQGGVPSSQKQGLNVKTEQRFSFLSPHINQIKLSALRMSQNYIFRARNPACTTSGTTGQHADTHFSSHSFFFFIQHYCREENTVSRFITSHQILQYYTSAVYYTDISVARLRPLCLTDDTEGNMHQRKYPCVDCGSLTNEIKNHKRHY